MGIKRAFNGHAVVAFLFDELKRQKRPAYRVATRAGMSVNIITHWRNGKEPSIGNLEAVLNVLGYRLAVVPLEAAE